ncbi:hypothetical protein IJG12_00740 [Candidatus Saccharibacteria bacterium]|nr:hypothetical protein [Candidatus Saccharibacteria bacterium]
MSKAVDKLTIATLSLVGLTVFAGAILMSSGASADDSAISNVSVNVPVACTMTGTSMNSHNATIPNGTYQANIGTTTMKAVCNDSNGFAIYAIGYTDNEYGKTVLTNSTLGSSSDIATGTATSIGSPDVSNWAMKLATNSSATYPLTLDNSFGNYHNVPAEYTKVAHRDSGTDIGTSAVGSELTSTYAAYMSKTQPAGTYIGQVKYTLVHPSSHAAPVVCNDNATTISEAKCLQDFAHVTETNLNSIIASMTPEQQYTLKDSRDGKTYTIAKYQVGNTGNYDVWMTQNLDLDLQAGETYTNEDTDIGYNTTTQQYETAAWSPARSTYTATTGHIHEWCQGGTWNSQDGYCELNDTPESYDPGDLYWNATESDYSDWSAYHNSCDYSTPTPSCDQSLNPISTYVSSTGTAQYHLGNYYNWAAALATNDSSQFNSSELVEQSICPAGWTMPRTGTGEDTFYGLWNQYGFSSSSINGNNNLWTSPLYFAAGGFFNGYLGGVGYNGNFWSPIPGGSGAARSAYFNVDGDVAPSDNGGRSYGNSVRCVVRPVSDSVSGGGGGGPEGPYS